MRMRTKDDGAAVSAVEQAEQWLKEPQWHDGAVHQLVRDLVEEVRDLRAEQEKDMRMVDATLDLAKSNEHWWKQAEAHLEAKTAAIRDLVAKWRLQLDNYEHGSNKLSCDEAGQLSQCADEVDALLVLPTNQDQG